MRHSNPVLAVSVEGKANLELMRKALRGSGNEDSQTFTMPPEEGVAWGLPQGIVVNGTIEEDFGYPDILNNYHTPEYERMYARRKYLKRAQERIVFLSKDFLEQGECFHVSTSAYALFLDVDKKYIPDVTLSFSSVYCSCLIVHAGEKAALRPTSDERIGPKFAEYYKSTFANTFTEALLMALADTLQQGLAIRDKERPDIKNFVPGFAQSGHAPSGAVTRLALDFQVDILRRLQVQQRSTRTAGTCQRRG
jgi:hypothetical protein